MREAKNLKSRQHFASVKIQNPDSYQTYYDLGDDDVALGYDIHQERVKVLVNKLQQYWHKIKESKTSFTSLSREYLKNHPKDYKNPSSMGVAVWASCFRSGFMTQTSKYETLKRLVDFLEERQF